MPNWVEAVIAYLKKQVSLRFTMVWLLYLVALWVLLPESFFGFINAKPIIGSVNNINAILFIIPASFLLSDVTKRICKISDAASGVLKTRLESSQRKRDVTFQCEKLNPGEINLISKFAEQGSQMLYIPPGDRFLQSLLMIEHPAENKKEITKIVFNNCEAVVFLFIYLPGNLTIVSR